MVLVLECGVCCVHFESHKVDVLVHAVRSENEVNQGVHTWEEKARNMF